jgi:hypothetical protein
MLIFHLLLKLNLNYKLQHFQQQQRAVGIPIVDAKL